MNELEQMVALVKQAINGFVTDLQNSTYCILSEGDFERLLTNQIEQSLPKEYVIHNQVSYYGNTNALKYRVDAVIMKASEISNSEEIHKGYMYNGISVALELKYYKKMDRVSSIEKDIKKSVEFLNNAPNAFLFVIPLLEEDNGKKSKIDEIKLKFKNGNYEVITITETK